MHLNTCYINVKKFKQLASGFKSPRFKFVHKWPKITISLCECILITNIQDEVELGGKNKTKPNDGT